MDQSGECGTLAEPGVRTSLVWGMYFNLRIGLVNIQLRRPWRWAFTFGIEGLLPIDWPFTIIAERKPRLCGPSGAKHECVYCLGGAEADDEAAADLTQISEGTAIAPYTGDAPQEEEAICGTVFDCSGCVALPECTWCSIENFLPNIHGLCMSLHGGGAEQCLTVHGTGSWQTSTCAPPVQVFDNDSLVFEKLDAAASMATLIVGVAHRAVVSGAMAAKFLDAGQSWDDFTFALSPVENTDASDVARISSITAGSVHVTAMAFGPADFYFNASIGIPSGAYVLVLRSLNNLYEVRSAPFNIVYDTSGAVQYAEAGWIMGEFGACTVACLNDEGIAADDEAVNLRELHCADRNGDFVDEALCDYVEIDCVVNSQSSSQICYMRDCDPAVSECKEAPLSILAPEMGAVEDDALSASGKQVIPIRFAGGKRYSAVHIEFLAPDCSSFQLLKKVEDANEGSFDWYPTVQNYLYSASYQRNLHDGRATYTMIRVVSASNHSNRAITKFPVEIRLNLDDENTRIVDEWRVSGKIYRESVKEAQEALANEAMATVSILSASGASSVLLENARQDSTHLPFKYESFYDSDYNSSELLEEQLSDRVDLRWPSAVRIESVANAELWEMYVKPVQTSELDARKIRILFYPLQRAALDENGNRKQRLLGFWFEYNAKNFEGSTFQCGPYEGAWTCAPGQFLTKSPLSCAFLDDVGVNDAYMDSRYLDYEFDATQKEAEELYAGGFRESLGEEKGKEKVGEQNFWQENLVVIVCAGGALVMIAVVGLVVLGLRWKKRASKKKFESKRSRQGTVVMMRTRASTDHEKEHGRVKRTRTNTRRTRQNSRTRTRGNTINI